MTLIKGFENGDTDKFLKEIEWQLQKAKNFQKSLLPDKLEEWNCISFAARYIALDEIGGDYYDRFPIKGDKLGLLIADVSGHGIPAALITTMAKVTFDYFARLYDSPKIICQKVNDELIRYLPKVGAYLTAFFLIIDKDLNVKYTNAGHQHAIRYINATNSFDYLDTNGLFIGAFEDASETYEEKETKLHPGDRVILYTDGIVETKNSDKEEYGYDRFEEMVTFSSALNNEKLTDLIIDDIVRHSEGVELKDDISILALEVDLRYERYKEALSLLDEYKRNNEIDKWFEQANKVISLNPDDLQVKMDIAKYFYNDKNYKEAKQILLDFISRNEENYLAYYLLGNVHFYKDEISLAINSYSHCLKLHPNFPHVYNNIAAAYVKNGNIDKALKMVEKINNFNYSNKKIKQNIEKLNKLKTKINEK